MSIQAILTKVNEVKKFLNLSFFERNELIDGLFIALVARENLLMISPPGAAKTAVSRVLFKDCLEQVYYFEKAVTKTSKPEEVVGPLSLKGLENERYYHVTKGYLPECHVGLLDEVFKSNSSVLHLLLPLSNSGERLFQQEGSAQSTPLFTLLGTSNEYPEEDEGLEAFYNRFILRYEVDYIQEPGNFVKMLDLAPIDKANVPKVSLDELQQLQKACCQVTLTDETKEAMVKIWQELIAEGLRPSDRQFRDSVKLIKAMALLTEGRAATEPSDLDILRHSLWEKPDERQAVGAIVRKFCVDTTTQKYERLLKDAKEVYEQAIAQKTTEAGTEANKKLKATIQQLKDLADKSPSKKTQIESGLAQVASYNQEVLSVCLGI